MTTFMIGAGIFILCVLGGVGYLVYFFYQLGLKKQKADEAFAELGQLCGEMATIFQKGDVDLATVQTKTDRAEELLNEALGERL